MTSYVIRAGSVYAGGAELPAKVLVGGAGFTLGTTSNPVKGGLITLIGGNTVTVNTGTVLTLNSLATNRSNGIYASNALNLDPSPATSFVNKGTINILGTSDYSGIQLSPSATNGLTVINFENQNIINVDMTASGGSHAPLQVQYVSSGTKGTLNIINKSGATLNLKNNEPQTAFNRGCAMRIYTSTTTTPTLITADVNITNDGTINFSGSNDNFGGQPRTKIQNNGIINANYSFEKCTITNNATGVFNFSNPSATFTVLSTVAATAGALYTDGAGNSYSVINTKASGTGTFLFLRKVNALAATPATGTLTKSSGTGDATINYTAVATSSIALAAGTTNNGTINTGKGVESCGRLYGVTTTGNTSVLSPGGLGNKGRIDFTNTVLYTIRGKLVMQLSGNTLPGVDYDQIIKSSSSGNLNIDTCILDVSGIYTPSGSTTIDIITTNTNIQLVGTFSNVIGLGTGWSVLITPGVNGKVQLVYDPATPTTSTTWTGGTSTGWIEPLNWTNGVPTPNSDVTIDTGTFQPSPYVNVVVKSLTINVGASLTVNTDFNFTVTNAITNNGTMTIANNANLLQAGTTNINSGTGTYIIKRNSNKLTRLDYTLWSSPVQNQNLLAFSPLTLPNRFYDYDSATNFYTQVASPSTTNFGLGKGYLIRMPNNHPTTPTIWTGSFTGKPNNGNISVPLNTNVDYTKRYNLVGNPYPSPINMSSFVAANSTNITGTLWFWRKTNSMPELTVYPTWNGGTLVGNSEPWGDPNPDPIVIRTGQGFFVQALAFPSGDLVFNNEMRQPENSNQFFKEASINKTTAETTIEKHRIWLHLTNSSGYALEQAISYITNGTTEVDQYDAPSINFGNMLFNSIIPNATNQYVIQSRPLPFDTNDVIQLSVKITIPGNYSIAVNNKDGLFADGTQPIYLKDNYTNTFFDLNLGTFTFDGTAGTFNDRFELRFTNSTLSDSDFDKDANQIIAYQDSENQLVVNAFKTAIKTVAIYDLSGRLLFSTDIINQTMFKTSLTSLSNQVLLVQIATENGRTVTKKIIR